MDALNRPATRAELLAIASTTAYGVGFLIQRLMSKVSLNSDLDAFIEQALAGMESAKYDTDPPTKD